MKIVHIDNHLITDNEGLKTAKMAWFTNGRPFVGDTVFAIDLDHVDCKSWATVVEINYGTNIVKLQLDPALELLPI